LTWTTRGGSAHTTHINGVISAIAANGLNVEFNSLDAQRQASEALSASEHAEERGKYL